jgi:alpha-ketoglutarate-dependent taurine dioxygenase
MPQHYGGVITRTLSRAERRVPTEEEATPLVIEPLKPSGAAFLEEFLQHHSSQIHVDLAMHGAILLRGFAVDSPGDFERVILSIRGMCGIDEMLLSEPGRELVDGTRFVFCTNALLKTGGTLNLGSFHTENYFLPEVPRYIAFLCQVAGGLGGETGLLNDVKLYAALPDTLRRKLEERTCAAGFFAIVDMAARYAVQAEVLEKFCSDVNLPITDIDGERYVTVFKPSVIEHPLTHERALQINFIVVPGLNESMVRAFLPDYTGPRWLIHKAVWKYPWLGSTRSTRRVLQMLQRAAREGNGSYVRFPDAQTPPYTHPARTLFTKEEVEIMASCMRRYYSSFPWRCQDVLILDNFKIAHSGMAGIGKRELKAMMCNPVVLSAPPASPGLRVVPNTFESSMSLGAHLSSLHNGRGTRTEAPGLGL